MRKVSVARLAGAGPSGDQQRHIGAENSSLLLCVEPGVEAGLDAGRRSHNRSEWLHRTKGWLCGLGGGLLCRAGGEEPLLGVVCPRLHG
jgi:hypothetical protein